MGHQAEGGRLTERGFVFNYSFLPRNQLHPSSFVHDFYSGSSPVSLVVRLTEAKPKVSSSQYFHVSGYMLFDY